MSSSLAASFLHPNYYERCPYIVWHMTHRKQGPLCHGQWQDQPAAYSKDTEHHFDEYVIIHNTTCTFRKTIEEILELPVYVRHMFINKVHITSINITSHKQRLNMEGRVCNKCSIEGSTAPGCWSCITQIEANCGNAAAPSSNSTSTLILKSQRTNPAAVLPLSLHFLFYQQKSQVIMSLLLITYRRDAFP